MTTQTATLSDFILARVAEDEAAARQQAALLNSGAVFDMHTAWDVGPGDPARVLAECEAKRRIVELHQDWPVLVETQSEFESDSRASDIDSVTFRISKRMAWLTEREYRQRFGDEPPTAPMLRALALPYADHPDFREEWRA